MSDAIANINAFVYSSLRVGVARRRHRILGFVQGQLIEKVATFEDIALFETPDLLNLVQLTEKGVQRLPELCIRLVTMLSKPQSFENERKNRGFSHRESVSKHHW